MPRQEKKKITESDENSKADYSIRKNPLDGVTTINFSFGTAKSVLKYFGDEPMGIEGIPSWAKKELYIENIYRNKDFDKEDTGKGDGLILIKNIIEFAMRNKVDIITLKREEHSEIGGKLHNYYKRIGFVNVGNEEPLGMYLDLRTNEPLNNIKKLIEQMFK